MEKKRIIRVTGTGLLRLKPDLCCVNLNLSGVEKDYAAALDRAAKDSAALGAAIASGAVEVTEEEAEKALLSRLPEKLHELNRRALDLGLNIE